jgi:prepilin-type N-terminal cleavage/methylation domain-containing protein
MRERDGFTLIEVLVAMVILGFVIIGVQAVITDRMVRDVTFHDNHAVAIQLAHDRIHAVQQDPNYASIPARFAGVETGLAGAPGLRRTTFVATSGANGTPAFHTVTVTVSGDRLRQPVSRTIVVAAP